MSADEVFSSRLRERLDAVVPAVAVETSTVIPMARRRRRVVWVGGVTAVLVAVGGVTWAAVSTQPSPSATLAPAETPSIRASVIPTEEPSIVPSPTPTEEPSATPPEINDTDASGGWPDAPYWHTMIEYTSEDGLVRHQELWSGHTESGVMIGDDGVPISVPPHLWGSVLLNGDRVDVTWDVLYELPTDPVALEELLRASLEPDHGEGDPVGNDDDELFGMATDLLYQTPASPALRQAIWEILARLPGATVTDAVADSTGRAGTAIEWQTSYGVNSRLVFDPDDGRLLERLDQSPGVTSDGSPTTLSWHGLYLEEGPAETVPVAPALGSGG